MTQTQTVKNNSNDYIAKSEVIYVSKEDSCDSRIIAWYYLKDDLTISWCRQAPGVEHIVKSAGNILGHWSWDGSFTKWWEMLVECWVLGASPQHINQLAKARGCTNGNAILFGKAIGVRLYEGSGRHWASIGSTRAYGDSYLEAMGRLCRDLRRNGERFLELIANHHTSSVTQ